ncbi:MAG TPA: PAS domain S-box protein, partial [Gemmatimonadales bacterium]|nr:PAS domain S-box protein [Gemmatimonadales bacterium]
MKRFLRALAAVELKLPVLITALLVLVIGGLTWAAYLEVRGTTLAAADEHLERVTRQLSGLLEAGVPQRLAEVRQVAAAAALQRYVEHPSPPARAAGLRELGVLLSRDSVNAAAELWGAAGDRLLAVGRPLPPVDPQARSALTASVAGSGAAIGPLRAIQDSIFFPVVAAVPGDGKPPGYVVNWRRVVTTPAALRQVTELIGVDAGLLVGNGEGDLWTDLSARAAAPPLNVRNRPGVIEYARPGRGTYRARAMAIDGTPWILVVEFPRARILAPVRSFLGRAGLIALGLVAAGALGAWAVSRQASRRLSSETAERARELAERERAEAGLRESEKRYEQLVESIADYAILLIDAEGRIASWNTGAEHLKGYRADEIIGKHMSVFYTPEDVARGWPTELLRRAAAEGRVEDEGWRLRNDGSRFQADVIITARRGQRGQVIGFSKVTRDVTARRKAEARFQAVVEATPSGVVMMDRAGKIVLVNREIERLFGYARDELVGHLIEILVPARLREQHPGYRTRFFSSPQTRAMGVGRELFGLRRDGTEFPVEIGLNPLETDEGLFVLASVVDITARKRAETRFRAAVESSPNGMVMIDREGKIVLVNREIERLFGYARDELLGRPIETLVPEQLRSRHPALRTGFFDDPHSRAMGAGRELFGRRKDGREVPVEIGLNPLETDEGLFVLASVVDISARKRAEERFRAAVESSPNGMVMIDRDGKIVLVNREIERLFGYNRAELLGQPIETLVPEQVRTRHPTLRTGFFADPQSRAMGAGRELFGRRKDGREVPVEIGLNPLETDEGLFVLASVVDITARKRAETRFRAAVESSPNGMVMIDREGKIVLVN